MPEDTATSVPPEKGTQEYNEQMAQRFEQGLNDKGNAQTFDSPPPEIAPMPEGGHDKFYNKETGESRSVSTIGEADKSNCMSNYYGSMAEKRGIDRCVLKLINAYEWGISSEVEADDFKKQ